MSADTFLASLAAADARWLQDQLTEAQDSPPSNFASWHINSDRDHVAGFVPFTRLEQMAADLPQFRYLDGLWTWDIAQYPQAWSNTVLQAWLKQEYLNGRMKEWRDEMQDWAPNSTHHGLSSQPAAPTLTIERSGFRYLGLRSRAVHVNGFTADGRIVVGQRSNSKLQDPGLFDNLAAGGISAGESCDETLRRELEEEAGIAYPPDTVVHLWQGQIDTCRLDGDIWQSETLIVCNLLLSPHQIAVNRDGEVQQFVSMSASQAVQKMRDHQFTRDGIISLALGLGFARPVLK